MGALILGALLANHPKANELSKSLFSFKELMLVGFFLSVGMQGLPTWSMLAVAAMICILLPFKTFLYFLVVEKFHLRTRTSVLVSLSLGSYSEFGLIVSTLGVQQGWLPTDWLLIMALCISLSFAVSAPFNMKAEDIYRRHKGFWEKFQSSKIHPRDKFMATGDAQVLIVGMGRVGTGAYDYLTTAFNNKIIGIDHDASRVDDHRLAERKVMLGDATDSDFWTKLKAGKNMRLIILAMPNHNSNVFAAHQIRNAGLQTQIIAIAQHPQEVEELEALQVPSFNMYSEAGEGLARKALLEFTDNR